MRIKPKTYKISAAIIFTLIWVIVSACVNQIGLNDDNKVLCFVVWSIVSDFIIILFVMEKNIPYANLVLLVQVGKTIVLIFLTMYYGVDLIGFLDSDAFGFKRVAEEYYNGSFNSYYTNYPVVVSKLYHVFGQNASLVLLFNCCLTTLEAIAYSDIIRILDLKCNKFAALSMIIVLCNTMSLYISFSYWREAVYLCFLTLSLRCFVLWYKTNRDIDFLKTILLTAPAVYLHKGHVTFTVSFIMVFVIRTIFKRRVKRIHMIESFVMGGVFLLLIIYFKNSIRISDSIFEVLKERLDDALIVNAGSQYISNLKLETPYDMPFYLMMRMFYFLFSPTPSFWRGFSDIFVFALDSSIAIVSFVLSLFYLTKPNQSASNKSLVLSLLLIIFLTSLIFGGDTDTAGTAIRHRNVFMPIYALMITICGGRNKTIQCVE